MKILLLDIETSPNLATVWGLFNQNIGINQLLEPGYTLCWAAKWLGDDYTYFDSVYRSSPKQMVKRIHKMLSEADAVVHYNGTKFDIPTLNREFLMYGLTPPAPFKEIDLLRTVRNRFRFTSNKLDYVARQLGLDAKVQHKGMELWLGCMNKDKESWDIMEDYNVTDVAILEQLYDKLLPWIKGHANHSLHTSDEVCPHCGGAHYQKRGFSYTSGGKYQRFQCNKCGTWFRGTKSLAQKNKFVTSGV